MFRPDIIYYNGEYNLGPQPIYSKLLAIPQLPLVAHPTTFEHDNENVYAGYAQYSATFGEIDVVGGVRIEATEGNISRQRQHHGRARGTRSSRRMPRRTPLTSA